MTITQDTEQRIRRSTTLQWIRVSDLTVSRVAQRDLQQAHVDRLAKKFDVNKIGYIVVNRRDGLVYIIDGQHRWQLLKDKGLGDWELECETYDGLTEAQEADLFLELNLTRAVGAFQKFRIAVTAGRELECAIDDIVRECGMRVALDKSFGSTSAVTTLTELYQKGGAQCLARTLIIIREAYGWAGMTAEIMGGIGMMVQRFSTVLNDSEAIAFLGSAPAGHRGLLNMAVEARRGNGNSLRYCVAASATDIIRSQQSGRKKIPDWWRAGGGSGPKAKRETPQAALADAV